ncbi:MAG: hypothetical protein KKA84_03710 [Bacteroidetes bacterium]|nr:hypothetical protein [Bacteroidota bacterium]
MFRLIFIVLFSYIIQCSSVSGQTQAQKNNISQKVEALFKVAQTNDYLGIKNLILIEEKENEKTKFRIPDIENSSDVSKIKRYCNTLKGLKKVSDQFLIEEFKTEEYNGYNITVAILSFKSGDQTIYKYIRFAPLEKEYYLIKID